MRALLLDVKEQVFRIITNRESPDATSVITGVETLAINEAHTLELSVSLSPQAIIDLARARYIAIPVVEDRTNQYHMYTIQSVKNAELTLEVTAIEAAYDELAGYGYIEDRRFYDVPFSGAAKAIFTGTRWGTGELPADDPSVHCNYYRCTPLAALSKLIAAKAVEVNFIYTITGTSITGRTANFANELGEDTAVRFAYGDKAVSVVREESRTTLATAARGYGKGVQEIEQAAAEAAGTDDSGTTDDASADNPDDPTTSRKLTFEDVAWSVAAGNPVDKPAGQSWVELPEATAQWGYADGTPRMTELDFDDIADAGQLLQATYEALIDLARPKLGLSATVANVGSVGLGDRVTIVRHDLKIYYKARCIKVVRDLCDVGNSQVEVGDETIPSIADQTAQAIATASADTKQMAVAGTLKTRADLDKAINAATDALSARIGSSNDDLDTLKKDADARFKDIIGDLGTYKSDVTKQLSDFSDGYELKLSATDGKITDLGASIAGVEAIITDPAAGLSTTAELVAGLVKTSVSKDALDGRFTSERTQTEGLIADALTGPNGKIATISQSLDTLKSQISDGVTTSTFEQWKDEAAIQIADAATQVGAMVDVKLGQITLGLSGTDGAAGIQLNLPDGGTSSILLDADKIIGPNLIGLKHITLDGSSSNVDISAWGITATGAAGGNVQIGSPGTSYGHLSVYGDGAIHGTWAVSGDIQTTKHLQFTGWTGAQIYINGDGKLSVNDARGSHVVAIN